MIFGESGGGGKVGTLILEDVCTLAADEQTRLLQWLERAGPQTTIVSTAPHSLYPLVSAGLFDANLYYRLNVMLLHVDEAHQPSGDLRAQIAAGHLAEAGL